MQPGKVRKYRRIIQQKVNTISLTHVFVVIKYHQQFKVSDTQDYFHCYFLIYMCTDDAFRKQQEDISYNCIHISILWFTDDQILGACAEENLQRAQCICSVDDGCL
jgi:hypothetical protein